LGRVENVKVMVMVVRFGLPIVQIKIVYKHHLLYRNIQI
jgi:hypothetical protein